MVAGAQWEDLASYAPGEDPAVVDQPEGPPSSSGK